MVASVLTDLERRVEAHPEKLLFSYLDKNGIELAQHSYASFLTHVDLIAGHLAQRPGLSSGERVLLVFPPGLDLVCALFACARADLIAVPVAPPMSHGIEAAIFRITHVARDCRAVALLTTIECRDLLKQNLGSRAKSPRSNMMAALDCIVIEDLREDAPLACRSHGDIFFLQYTSGSTSQPKGVMVTHENILNNCRLVVDHDAPIAVSWLPQHHDMGLIGYYIFIALSGGTTYGFSTTSFIQRPALWLSTITSRRATASSAPNFAYEYCLQPRRISDEILATLDLSSLRFLMVAAEPVRPETYRRFLHKFQKYGLRRHSFFVAYGLAENTLAVTNYGRAPISVHKGALANGVVRLTQGASAVASARHIMSCGVPLADNKLRIVNPETNVPLSDGHVGEIWIAGSSRCKGYWGDSYLTTKIFKARIAGDLSEESSYLRTGDMGFLYSGELYVCGRLKDMIIIRGQNFFPQDIEAIVEECSSSLRSGCIAAFALDEESPLSVAVVAEVNAGQPLPNGETIVRSVRERLGVDIGQIVFVQSKSVPRTTSGKIMRFRARQMLLDGAFPVLAKFARGRCHGSNAIAAAGSSIQFDAVLVRYALKGNERITLLDAGVDSLDLVIVMHELKELLDQRGARLLADHVDFRFVQELTVADLSRLAEQFTDGPEAAVIEMREMLSNARAARAATERRLMRRDCMLPFKPTHVQTLGSAGPRSILLTGGTGFLGPFLLSSLLAQTDAIVHVLVRAENPNSARERLLNELKASGAGNSATIDAFDRRVVPICGYLERPNLGLSPNQWCALSEEIDVVFHNAALVNYLFTYERVRAANVNGTHELLRLAFEGRPKEFNHISTTFIFGWATKHRLYETDNNDEMALLDFGYSQSKWVSEQLVNKARRAGLLTRIFRPALVTPSVHGAGSTFDITIRLLTFMIKHGIGVSAMNQVSFVPVDVTANNIVAISQLPQTLNRTFHVTRDKYANMIEVTDILSNKIGCSFKLFPLRDFVPEVIRLCTKEDILFPLLDFFIGSIDNISTMEFKRYDSSLYQSARDASIFSMSDPSLEQTVDGILAFIRRHQLL
jgi:thioester reductase-like protein